MVWVQVGSDGGRATGNGFPGFRWRHALVGLVTCLPDQPPPIVDESDSDLLTRTEASAYLARFRRCTTPVIGARSSGVWWISR